MRYKRRLTLAIVFILIVFHVNSLSSARAAEIYDTHIVIAYDISGSVVKNYEAVSLANNKLASILYKIYKPGDVVSLYYFGIDRQNFSYLRNANNNKDFIRRFLENNVFISWRSSISETNAGRLAAKGFPDYRIPERDYTLSYYIEPLLIIKMSERRIYAQKTIIFLVSDFITGTAASDNTEDVKILKELKIQSEFINTLEYIKAEFNNKFKNLISGKNCIIHETNSKIKIRQFELEPNNLPSLSLIASSKNVSERFGDHLLAFPDLSVEFRNNDYFKEDRRFLNINGKQLEYSNTPKISVKDVPDDISKLHMRVYSQGLYNYSSEYEMALPYVIVSNRVPLIVKRLPTRLLTFLSVILSGGVIAFIPFYLFGRKPSISCSVIYPSFAERVIIKDTSCPCCSCLEGQTIKIKLVIRNNSGKYNMRQLIINEVKLEDINPGAFKGVKIDLTGVSQKNISLNRGNIQEYIIKLRCDALKDIPYNPISMISIRYYTGSNAKNESHGKIIFTIRPHLGNFWLCLDPGTIGSCAAGGTGINDIKLLKVDGTEIIPSIVIFKDDGKRLIGEEASSRLLEVGISIQPERVFMSAKKVLGYENKRELEINGEKVAIKGSHAVEELARYLVENAKKQFKDEKISQVIVAVPNTFTPRKIKVMEECCKKADPDIKKVEHIYEAEAVLLYYCKDYNIYNEKRPENNKIDGKEFILIIDFGGGSFNVTLASYEFTSDKKTNLDVIDRIGYNIGGNSIDLAIAKFLWNEKKLKEKEHYFRNSPFERKEDISSEEKELRNELKWQLSEKSRFLKEDISRGNRAASWPLKLSSMPEEISLEITLNEIFNSQYYKKILYFLKEGLLEVIGQHNEPLHTLIFSGRSSSFPGIKEELKKIINAKAFNPYEIEINDPKGCVAIGGAFYGIQRKNINLSRKKSFANYGLLRFNSPQTEDLDFLNIIPRGESYAENNSIEKVAKDIDISFNGTALSFYQVMGSNPAEILKKGEGVKDFLLWKTSVSENKKLLKKITMHITAEDNISIVVKDIDWEISYNGNIDIKDIYEDDSDFEWLLY